MIKFILPLIAAMKVGNRSLDRWKLGRLVRRLAKAAKTFSVARRVNAAHRSLALVMGNSRPPPLCGRGTRRPVAVKWCRG